MSWSVTLIGEPAKVADALVAYAEKLEGQSKVEYVDALPHMLGLVKQNWEPTVNPQIKIAANGHGYAADGEQKQRYLTVSLERFYGNVV